MSSPALSYLRSAQVIINVGSGTAALDAIQDAFKVLAEETGLHFTQTVLQPQKAAAQAETLVEQAAAEGQTVIAVGGDGTISLVASLCCKHKVLMSIIPTGTFNYFARDLGISTDVKKAIALLPECIPASVSVGMVNERLFLNNASFGIYTTIIKEREQYNKRFGRIRWIAAVSAMKCLFVVQRAYTIQLKVGDSMLTKQSLMLFVGKNNLQLDNLGLGSASCTERDQLAVICMPPLKRVQTAMLLLQAAFGMMRFSSALEEFCASDFEVHTRKRQAQIAMDGELVSLSSPLRFSVLSEALHVLAPPPAPKEAV